MRRTMLLAGVAMALAMGPAAAQNKSVKIGFVSTFSGPTAVIGNDMRNAFELALDHMGRKMGGLPVEVIYEDDTLKPEVGKQKTEKLIESDKVDFVSGYHLVERRVRLVQADRRLQDLPGHRQCRRDAARRRASARPTSSRPRGPTTRIRSAVAEYMNKKGVKSVYLIGPNYAAGKENLGGFKAAFKGKVLGEDYTTWPAQLDFSAELAKAKAAKPEAVYMFYPGAAGVQFLNQYAQAGLQGPIPLYTTFSIDSLSLPRQKDAALGVISALQWAADLPNDANKKFVADFKAKYQDRAVVLCARRATTPPC